jgi:hypothetical protein
MSLPGTSNSAYERLSLGLQLTILIVSLVVGLEAGFAGLQSQAMQDFEESCRRHTQTLAAQTEPEVYIRARLLPLLAPFQTNRPYSLEKICRSISKTWALDLLVYRFSESGELVSVFPQKPPHVWFMQRLYKALSLPLGPELMKIRSQIDKQIPFLFGDGKDLATLRDRRKTRI